MARVAEQLVGNFNTQNLANTAWAFSTTGESDVPLFMAIARVARAGDFKPQELANTAWAFATAGQSHAQLFTAWASATAGQSDIQLFTAFRKKLGGYFLVMVPDSTLAQLQVITLLVRENLKRPGAFVHGHFHCII